MLGGDKDKDKTAPITLHGSAGAIASAGLGGSSTSFAANPNNLTIPTIPNAATATAHATAPATPSTGMPKLKLKLKNSTTPSSTSNATATTDKPNVTAPSNKTTPHIVVKLKKITPAATTAPVASSTVSNNNGGGTTPSSSISSSSLATSSSSSSNDTPIVSAPIVTIPVALASVAPVAVPFPNQGQQEQQIEIQGQHGNSTLKTSPLGMVVDVGVQEVHQGPSPSVVVKIAEVSPLLEVSSELKEDPLTSSSSSTTLLPVQVAEVPSQSNSSSTVSSSSLPPPPTTSDQSQAEVKVEDVNVDVDMTVSHPDQGTSQPTSTTEESTSIPPIAGVVGGAGKVITSKRLQKLQSLVMRASLYSKFLKEKLPSLDVKPSSTGETVPASQVPTAFPLPKALEGNVTLRDYQLQGVRWLVGLYDNGLNGILADEMGLGKTLQTIAFLAHLRGLGTLGPFLIVGPLSTLGNWKKEFERFAPSIPVLLYHGSPQERKEMRDSITFKTSSSSSSSKKGKKHSLLCPVIITSYEMVMNDAKHLRNGFGAGSSKKGGGAGWKYIVVDEGHRLKNMNCKLIMELKSYTSANRLLLTGTPLQNNLTELWSLLNFLMPGIFDDLGAFEEWFEFENDIEALGNEPSAEVGGSGGGTSSIIQSLHTILSPFLLRRVKVDVMGDTLPPKREYLLHAPMLPKQRLLYQAVLKGELQGVLERSMADLYSIDSQQGDRSRQEGDVLEEGGRRKKQRLDEAECEGGRRKIYKEVDSDDETSQDPITQSSSFPATSRSLTSNQQHLQDAARGFIRKVVGSQNLQMLMMQLRKVANHPYLFHLESEMNHGPPALIQGFTEVVAWSGKMLLLDRLLTALLMAEGKGHKVLIFSQMTSMLNIIQDWLTFEKGWKACRIDGTVKLEERQRQIEDFNTQPDVRIFLLSTRAGGLGINLTAADTVIIFDSDWNPQVDLQAQDRVHRIGQTKPVLIFRFITTDSIEKRILDKAKSKRNLEKIVIHKNKFKGSTSTNSKDLLDGLNIQEILDEEAQAITGKEIGAIDTEKIPSLDSILTDEELAKILDRSDAAYEEFNKAGSAEGGGRSGGEEDKIILEASDKAISTLNSNLFG